MKKHPPSQKKLNLGSGLTFGSSWLNIDGSWNAWMANHPVLANVLEKAGLISTYWRKWPHGIVFHNILTPLPFPDASMEAVYASHLIEHVHRNQVDMLLRDISRVLSPGGKLRLVTPHLGLLIRRYNHAVASGDPQAAESFNIACSFHPQDEPLFFSARGLYQALNNFHQHFWLWDPLALKAALEEHGFCEVRLRGFCESDIPDIAEVERPGAVGDEHNSFALEAQKPT